MATLHVQVVSPELVLYEGDAEMLVCRTTEGEIGVLAGHAPLLGQLADPAQVRIKPADGEELAYDVAGGFLSVTAEGVTILAEECTPAAPATVH